MADRQCGQGWTTEGALRFKSGVRDGLWEETASQKTPGVGKQAPCVLGRIGHGKEMSGVGSWRQECVL